MDNELIISRKLMKKFTTKRIARSERLLKQVVAIESALDELPKLSILEKAQLDHNRAIEDLYYSSRLEGSKLTPKRIEQAIYGKKLSAA